jgi:DNA-binding MarR family transcriptional regulator
VSLLKLDEFFPFRLSVASNAVSSYIATAYEALYGLRIPEWRLVAVLAEDGPMTQQALVGRTGMDKVTISRAAHSLSKRRLIKRVAHESDGRSHHLILTEEGENLFARVSPKAIAMQSEILKSFTATEIETLMGLLHRVREAALSLQKDEKA